MDDSRTDVPHLLVVDDDGPHVFHPNGCARSITVGPAGTVVDYACAVGYELEMNGTTDLPTEPGLYIVATWFETIPGGPWGPTEYDGGWAIEPVKSAHPLVVKAIDALSEEE